MPPDCRRRADHNRYEILFYLSGKWNSGTVSFRVNRNRVMTFPGLIGVIVDPTTAGIGDSERALGYEEPWDDNR